MRTLLLTSFLALFGTVAAQNAPRIALVPWAVGLDTITDITYSHAGDTRLFVVKKQGMIEIITDSMTVAAAPFLDISDQVLTIGHEQGLLGLAFDPDYANNGFFYVNYIAGTGSGTSIISRWSVGMNPNIADAMSEQILYTVPQPYENHNGGDLAFGPDGYLYIPLGDGGDAGDPQGHAQNLMDPLGDVIRLDVSDPDTTYTIPASNPFVNAGTDTLPEIWASGLRNPFRFSFDRMEGDMWIGDVGQSSWEEVNYVEAGENDGPNFGWRCYEGPAPFNILNCEADSAYVLPVTAHINDGMFTEWCSVIGGYVYRGATWPHLYGQYIYTDYCKQQFWGLHEDGNGGFMDMMLLEDTNHTAWTTFGENAAGELFVGNETPGHVFKIVDACPMDAPTITFNGTTLLSSISDSTYMWFLNGFPIMGANGVSYIPGQDGDYYVQAIFENGCMLNSDTLSLVITGVNEMAVPLLSIQPNPAGSTATISWSQAELVGEVRLMDLQGRVIYRQNPTASRITMELDGLATGNYMIQLLSREGLVLTVQQLAVMN